MMNQSNHLRTDGRAINEIRSPHYYLGEIQNVEGSARVIAGFNNILVTVRGPRIAERWNREADRGSIVCRYTMHPFSVAERKRPSYDRRSAEISKILENATESCVLLEKYPGCEIQVNVDVLSCDGSSRVTALGAICLALIDAGIEIKGLFAGCSIGRYEDRLMVDLSGLEDNKGNLDLAMGGIQNQADLILFQSDGIMTDETMDQAMQLGNQGLQEIFQLQESILKQTQRGFE